MSGFQKGERRKNPNWRAFTIVTGKLTRAGVMVQFDPDPLDGRTGGRMFIDEQFVKNSEVLAAS